MEVIVFSGQSNMQGQTEGLPNDNPVVGGALEYRYLTDTLVPLTHPVGEDILRGEQSLLLRAHNGGGSLVPAFCKEYAQGRGKEIIAIHAARGATKIEEWLPDTERYRVLVEKINRGVKKANETERVDNVYFVWLQGCSDAIAHTSAQEYKDAFTALKNALKKDTPITAFGIIRVGYFASVARWNKRGTQEEKTLCDEAIMQAQEDIVRENADCVMLTRICSRLSLDENYLNPYEDGHYNNVGMEYIGKDAAKTALTDWE